MLAEFDAFKEVEETVKSFAMGGNSSSQLFIYSERYSYRITLSVVVGELSRNIMLAMSCVFVCVLFLIANFTATIIVCCTVAITLMDVAGNDISKKILY